MKKIIAFFLSVMLIFSMNSTVFAGNDSNIENNEWYILNPIEGLDIYNLSIFFVKQTYSDNEVEQLSTDDIVDNTVELNNQQKETLLSNPLYIPILNRVKKLLQNGIKVEKIIFNVDYDLYEENEKVNTYSSIPPEYNQASFWKQITKSLGSYNGYDFRYVQSVLSIEDSYKPIKNVSTSVTWGQLIKYYNMTGYQSYTEDIDVDSIALKYLQS